MVPKAGYFTPLLHVMDVRRSIRFYELLGFELIDTEGAPECPSWARMHCEGGAVMFLLAEEPFDPTKHAVLTAMYTPDRKSTRLNSSHSQISYAVFCLKKKKKKIMINMTIVRYHV